MEFKTPWILALIPFAVALILVFYRRLKEPSFRFSSVSLFSGIKENLRVRLSRKRIWLRLIAIIFVIIALAGPREVLEETIISSEGIDIVLAVDSSGSMAAEDFKIGGKRVNRLDVVKNVVRDFVKERKTDRIALVTFAGLAYTVCPLTTDYDWLMTNLERVELGLIEDGTAVGSAIVSSLSRLEESKTKSKVIILLTDGVNNRGETDPVTAAKAAKSLGAKIYTIGAGSKGLVPFPARDLWGRRVYQKVRIDLDEETLKDIAKMSNGLYFRATDTESLREIYEEIDALEKTKIEQKGFREYKELFEYFLWIGVGFLIIELLLFNSILLKVP